MHRHINIATYLAWGFLSAVLIQSPGNVGEAWAVEGQGKQGSQVPSHGAEVTIPDGVIGVSLHVGAERVGDPAALYVAHVFPEGPAQQAGLQQGDEIITVDGQAVTGKTYEQVVIMVRGEAGTVVKLGVKGEGGARELSVTRVASQKLYKGQMGSPGGPAR